MAKINGGVPLTVGRGFEGFVTSCSSYAITVIRAMTGNVSGGTPVPALTNAVARI